MNSLAKTNGQLWTLFFSSGCITIAGVGLPEVFQQISSESQNEFFGKEITPPDVFLSSGDILLV